jgi:energy-converting hydrogenase Eha subunit H
MSWKIGLKRWKGRANKKLKVESQKSKVESQKSKVESRKSKVKRMMVGFEIIIGIGSVSVFLY